MIIPIDLFSFPPCTLSFTKRATGQKRKQTEADRKEFYARLYNRALSSRDLWPFDRAVKV